MPRLIDKSALQFFANNGVPPTVLHNNFALNYEDSVVSVSLEINNNLLKFSTKKQHECLTKIWELSKPFFAVLSGEYHDSVPAQVALALCVHSVRDNKSKAFHWHSLTGSPGNPLLDNDVRRADMEGVHLLIISGVAGNSTNMKVEKLRDLLTHYGNIPVVLVLSGANPLEYCFHTLHIKPNYVVHFGKEESHEKE